MVDCEDAHRIAFDDRPLHAHARPIVQDFAAVDDHGAVSVLAGSYRFERACQHFLPHHVHDQYTARPQAGVDVAQHRQVFIFVIEIAERRKHAERQIERFRPRECAHILLYPLDGDAFRRGPLPGLVEEECRPVHAGDLKAAPRQGYRKTSRPAAKIENCPRTFPNQSQQRLDLFLSGGDARR